MRSLVRFVNPDEFGRKFSSNQNYQLLKELGDCYTAADNFERAVDCYRQAVSAAPGEPGPYIGLGVIALQFDQPDDAAKAFKTAMKLKPDCSEAHGGMAMVHQRRKEYPQAFDMYLKCLEADPDNLVALLGLFQTSCQMGTFSKVIHYLEVFLDMHPDDTSVLFCLATLYARDGRLYEARDALVKVLSIDHDKKEAATLLTKVHSNIAKAQAGEAIEP